MMAYFEAYVILFIGYVVGVGHGWAAAWLVRNIINDWIAKRFPRLGRL